MTTADCIPDLETRKKNPYEYFPYFDNSYKGDEQEYNDAVDRHALMFPERPRIRRNWRVRGELVADPIDEYFRHNHLAQYPVLVKGKDDPVDDPKIVPTLDIRRKNRLEYFPYFLDMWPEEFKRAAKEHAKLWPDRPEIIKTIIIVDDIAYRMKEAVIYKGDPYPVLIAPW